MTQRARTPIAFALPFLAACIAGCSGEVEPTSPTHGAGGRMSGTSGTTRGSTSSSSSSDATSSISASSGPSTTVTSGAGGPGSGSGGGGAGGAGMTPPGDGGVTEDDLQFCIDENNRYRATVGSPPLVRVASLDAFAAVGAKYDYDAMQAHKHFGDSKGVPGGTSSAENEIPGFGGWNLKTQKTVHAVIAGGLKDMWDEGPGGGHYENMKNPSNKKFGCGVYVAPNAAQDVTVTMDFTN